MRTPVEVSAKILLAEDDTDMRRFLVKALQNAGYSVASFDNGVSAYNRLREEPFELLLTDIVMPEMDGIELARCATRLDPEIKVMFITGFAAVALNPDNNAPQGRADPVEAVPPSRPCERGRTVSGGGLRIGGRTFAEANDPTGALRAHHATRQNANAALPSPWFGYRADRALDLEAARPPSGPLAHARRVDYRHWRNRHQIQLHKAETCC